MQRREWLAWSMASLGAGAMSALLPRSARAGACATPGFAPVYRTPAGTTIGPGGAIVLGLDMSFGGGMAEPFGGQYTLTVAGTPMRLHAAPLAPGLVRLVPHRFVAGAGVVSGPAGELAVTVVDTAVPLPAPCRVTRVDMVRHAGSQQPYYPETWGLQARLRSALPASVVGVVVAPAAEGSAYGLFAVRSGDALQPLYHSPGRCQADAPGVNPPPVGSRIRLACVGANGAVSARSNDVEIRE